MSLESTKKKKPQPAKNYDNFSTFVYKMIKKVEPDLQVSGETIDVLNDMGHTFIQRLMSNCVKLIDGKRTRKNKKGKTPKPLISSNACSLAVHLMFAEVTTGDYSQYHPMDSFRSDLRNEGMNGIRKYEEYEAMRKSVNEPGKPNDTSFTTWAKLSFPLDRVKRIMRKYCPRRYAISAHAKVFVLYALQQFYSEIIYTACAKTRSSKIRTITPRHVNSAIREDLPISAYFTRDYLVHGSVMPGIHAARLSLMPTN